MNFIGQDSWNVTAGPLAWLARWGISSVLWQKGYGFQMEKRVNWNPWETQGSFEDDTARAVMSGGDHL